MDAVGIEKTEGKVFTYEENSINSDDGLLDDKRSLCHRICRASRNA
jgi:hypothetical protein